MSESNHTSANTAEAEEYKLVLRKMRDGVPVTLNDLAHHVGIQNRGFRTGVEIGAKIPDMSLPDQDGRIRDFASLTGPKGLLLVFARTVDWCPYCRHHASELDRSFDAIAAKGLGIALVTVDKKPVIDRFVQERPVRYPVLRDEECSLVRRFGIANENIPENMPVHTKGMPYPGNYLIGPDQTVLDKAFMEDYQFRPASTLLVMKHFGPTGNAPVFRIKASELEAEISLSSHELYPGQEMRMEVRVMIKPGWHVYGQGVAEGYFPLSVELAGEMFSLHELEFPPSKTKRLAPAGQSQPVLEGSFVVAGRIRVRWSAPEDFERLKGLQYLRDEAIQPGEYSVSGNLRFQPCSESVCGVPQSVAFSLPITILPELGRPKDVEWPKD